ncbi:polysaccharide deacetylase family protein [Microbacterium sp. NPDC012755]|uniref:polysaccharide deacetylase family protein n=1 Tax=Microbacterium sp. NPDC012755 TaxID=3364184 RepID=UPI00367D4774
MRPGFFMFGASGPYSGAPRVLDLFSGHDVRATFFTPAWVVRTWPNLCRRIVAEGQELAGHGRPSSRSNRSRRLRCLKEPADIHRYRRGVRIRVPGAVRRPHDRNAYPCRRCRLYLLEFDA